MRQRWFRLLPVMMMTFIIAFMDRTNIGFAIPHMGKELALGSSTLGFASGVLFLGYGLSQSAGGWLADRGHGKWVVALLMVLWGVTEIAQGFIRDAQDLVVIRFLIGLFEGGVFPTFLLFVKNWFAPSERARANGIWQLCYPIAALVSGPIAGYILGTGDWRTLFIVEGIFPLVWVFAWLWGVADSPAHARWLRDDERTALLAKIERETREREAQTGRAESAPTTLAAQMRRVPVLLFTTAVLLWNIGFLGFVIWLPSVIQQQPGLSSVEVGWLSAIPYALAIVVMQWLTHRSDRTLDRRLYSAVPLAISALALIAGGLSYAGNSFALNMVLLSVAGATLYGSQPILWAIPVEIVPARVLGAASGIINGIGVLGAFLGPYVVGFVRSQTQTFASGLLVMGVCLLGTSALILAIRDAGPPRGRADDSIRTQTA